MKSRKGSITARAVGLAAACVALVVAPLRADTVVTRDGRRFTGEVRQGDGEYVVKTKLGEVHVGLSEVERIETGSPAVAAATAPAPAAGAGATRPPAAKHVVDPKTLEALLKQGRDALSAGEYKAARDAFADAAAAADKNAEAQHGLGLAYMYLNDFARARDPMEKALTAAGGPAGASRALVLNMCVCQIAQRNPMRGAKVVMDHLQSHAKDLDEPLLNAMGTALNLADAQAKKGGLFQQCLTFYVTYNAKLEAQNPGNKRWGVTWMRAADVDRKVAKNGTIEREMSRLDKELDALERQMDKEQREIDALPDLIRRGYRSDVELQIAREALKQDQGKHAELQKQYDAEAAKREFQSFPRAMTLVAMDDLTPPPVGGQTAVADASPLFPEIAQPKAPSRKAVVKKAGSVEKPEKTTEAPPPEAPQISIAAQPAPKRNVRVTTYAAAFPVADGLVLTAAAPVANATEIMLQTADGTPLKAQLVRADEKTGLALLRVTERRFVPLSLAAGFTGGPVTCAAYPSVNIFNPVAETINGTAKAVAAADWRVSLTRHPRLGGAPLLSGNRVVGVELASRETEAANVPAATVEQIWAFLGTDAPAAASSGTGPDPTAAILQLSATRESSGG